MKFKEILDRKDLNEAKVKSEEITKIFKTMTKLVKTAPIDLLDGIDSLSSSDRKKLEGVLSILKGLLLN